MSWTNQNHSYRAVLKPDGWTVYNESLSQTLIGYYSSEAAAQRVIEKIQSKRKVKNAGK